MQICRTVSCVAAASGKKQVTKEYLGEDPGPAPAAAGALLPALWLCGTSGGAAGAKGERAPMPPAAATRSPMPAFLSLKSRYACPKCRLNCSQPPHFLTHFAQSHRGSPPALATPTEAAAPCSEPGPARPICGTLYKPQGRQLLRVNPKSAADPRLPTTAPLGSTARCQARVICRQTSDLLLCCVSPPPRSCPQSPIKSA